MGANVNSTRPSNVLWFTKKFLLDGPITTEESSAGRPSIDAIAVSPPASGIERGRRRGSMIDEWSGAIGAKIGR